MFSFLVAIAVVLLSVLYLLYSSQDAGEVVAGEPRDAPRQAPLRGPLTIFFGSQTGKAEAFSQTLARAARCDTSALSRPARRAAARAVQVQH